MNLDREMAVLLEHDYRRGRLGYELDEDDLDEAAGHSTDLEDEDPLTAKLRAGILEMRCWEDEEELLEFQVPSPAQVRAKFFLPRGVETFSHKTPVGLYIVTWEQHGSLYGIAFSGARKKPDWHLNFGPVYAKDGDKITSNAKRMHKRIQATIRAFKSSQNSKAETAAEKTSYQHEYKVGDILYSSWGYDQTNVNFWQVVKTTEKSIAVRELMGKSSPNGVGSDRVMPAKGKFKSSSTAYKGKQSGMKRVRPGSGGRGSIKMTSSYNAYHWDGRPIHQTAYGFGH